MSIVGALPSTIANGQLEDAVPVMANFNWLMNQVNANAYANTGGTITGNTTITGALTFGSSPTLAASGGSALVGYGTQTVSTALAVLPGQNFLYNGSFDAVLNAGPVALTNTYAYPTSDAWAVFQNTVAAGAAAVVASDITGFAKYLKMGRTAGNSATNSIIAQSFIRTVDAAKLQGKTVVLSFYAKAGVNFSGANINVALFTGTGTDEGIAMSGWTGVLTPISTVQAITTTGTQYSFSATLAANATEVGVRVYYTPTGTAGADDNLYLTGFKLEVGTVPTAVIPSNYPSVILPYRPPMAAGCRLSNYGVGDPFSQCQLVACNGNQILINGVPEIVPSGNLSSSGGITATYSSCSVDKVLAQSLVAENLYYIYVYMLNGVMTFDFSLQAFVTHPIYGNPVKVTDSTCSLVGICWPKQTKTFTVTGGAGYTGAGRYLGVALTGGTGTGMTADITVAGGAVTVVSVNDLGKGYTNGDVLTCPNTSIGGAGAGWSMLLANCAITTYGGARGQTISSYYNKFIQRLETAVSGSTTSVSMVVLDDGVTNLANGERQNNFLEWVQWFDSAATVAGYANVGNTLAAASCSFVCSTSNGLGVGTANSGFVATAVTPTTNNPSICLKTENDAHDATGYYRAWAKGLVGAGTGTFAGIMFADGVMS